MGLCSERNVPEWPNWAVSGLELRIFPPVELRLHFVRQGGALNVIVAGPGRMHLSAALSSNRPYWIGVDV